MRTGTITKTFDEGTRGRLLDTDTGVEVVYEWPSIRALGQPLPAAGDAVRWTPTFSGGAGQPGGPASEIFRA